MISLAHTAHASGGNQAPVTVAPWQAARGYAADAPGPPREVSGWGPPLPPHGAGGQDSAGLTACFRPASFLFLLREGALAAEAVGAGARAEMTGAAPPLLRADNAVSRWGGARPLLSSSLAESKIAVPAEEGLLGSPAQGQARRAGQGRRGRPAPACYHLCLAAPEGTLCVNVDN